MGNSIFTSDSSKRRRVEGTPAAPPFFSYVGSGHYRYVPGVCRWFQNTYRIKYQSETWWGSTAASVSCAELCLVDEREQGWDGSPNVPVCTVGWDTAKFDARNCFGSFKEGPSEHS